MAGRARAEVAVAATAAPDVVPAQAGKAVVPYAALPALNFQGESDVCRTWVAAQNVGTAAARAVLVVFGNRPACVSCADLAGVECSGLIKPGSSWNFLGAQIPTGSASGIVFSFNDRPLTEIAPALGLDDRAADYLCERIYFDTVGDCAKYAAFKAAADTGGVFAGVPLGAAAGAPLAVTALRHCPGDETPGVEVSSTYEAILSASGFARDDVGAYISRVAPVYGPNAAGPIGANSHGSILYVQNTGSRCAMVEVWLKSSADVCAAAEQCHTLELAAGTAARIDLSTCAPEDWVGAAWVRSPDPIALVAEIANNDLLLTYTGAVPGAAHDVTGAPGVTTGSTELYAPLVYDPRAGWTTSVVVQNMDDAVGLARVTFLDHDGTVLGRLEGELCAEGSRAFDLPATDFGAEARPASARVESLAVSGGAANPLSAVLLASRRAAAGAMLTAGLAYRLVPAALAYAGPGAPGAAGGTAAGVGVLALPLAPADLDGTGVTTELAIQNLVPIEGETEVAVLLYDRNDLTKTICRTLAAGAIEYVDLRTEGTNRTGFLHAAVVSATVWRHPEPGTGRDRVGLAAVAIHRSGTARGQDIPGDEIALSSAIPLRAPPVRVAAAAGECPPPARPPLPTTGDPSSATYGAVFLPALQDEGQDDVCQAVVTVTNGSEAAGKAVMVLFGEPGYCAPQCAGPSVLACSGLLTPGGTWQFNVSSVTTGRITAFSAVVYGFKDRTLAQLGVPGGGETPVADWLCAQGGLVDDCDESRRLHWAYVIGGDYKGIPMAAAYAAPFVATVARECPDIERPGVAVDSRYDGLSGAHFDLTKPPAGGYWQSAVPMYADAGDRNSIIYIQNAGVSCTSVTVSFRALGECSGGSHCGVFTISPGEAYQWDVSDCVGPDWAGTAYLRSDAPLAIAVDELAPSVLRTWSEFPGWSPYDLNDDGVVNDADLGVLDAAIGGTPASGRWNPRADLDHNGVVNRSDRALLELGGLCREPTLPTETPVPTATAAPTATATPTARATRVTPTASPAPVTATPTSSAAPPGWRMYLPYAEKRSR